MTLLSGWRAHKTHSPVKHERTSIWVCSCGAALSAAEAEKILKSQAK